MTTHDPRTPLVEGGRLTLQTQEYVVQEIVGFGGSCLAYRAERKLSENEHKVDMPTIPAIIKEFYPFELTDGITRKPDGELTMQATVRETFDLLRERFESSAAKQTAFCVNDSNHSLPLPLLGTQNGTAYTAVVLTNGQTLSECAADLSMLEKADVITSLCNAIRKLHDSGRLYLDLKPSNIFVFEREQNESRRVALFDFDTALDAADITKAAISYSEGWSPHEQINQRKEEISYPADIYAIGAVCYWLYSGKTVSDDILNEIVRGRFGFLDDINELRGGKGPAKTIASVLSVCLKRVPSKRAQRVDEIPL
jgi:serine/threonine protein kinase